MSARLTETYRRAAARVDHDPDDPTFGYRAMLASVSARADQRARRRRIARGAGAGSAAVAVVIAVTLIVGNSVNAGPHHQAAGPQPTRSGPAKQTLPSSTTRPSVRRSAALAPPPSGAALARVAAAPGSAPLSLGVAPKGWRYVGSNASATSYAPPGGTTGSGDFVGAIAAMVGDPRPGEAFPTTIAGLPARVWLSGGTPNLWLVDLRYNTKILITIQVWPNARLSRAQVVRMAGTLKVRDVSHPASG